MSWDRQLVRAGIILKPMGPGSSYPFHYFVTLLTQSLSLDTIHWTIIHIYSKLYKCLRQKLIFVLEDLSNINKERRTVLMRR